MEPGWTEEPLGRESRYVTIALLPAFMDSAAETRAARDWFAVDSAAICSLCTAARSSTAAALFEAAALTPSANEMRLPNDVMFSSALSSFCRVAAAELSAAVRGLPGT